MKKVLIITGFFLAALTTTAQTKTDTTKQKEYSIKLTENQLQVLWSSLEFSKQNLQTSQAPANEVNSVNAAITALQGIIKEQYAAQSDTTKKK